MTSKRSMTLAEQQATAAAIAEAREAHARRQEARMLATGEAIRWPCGCVGIRNHGLDGEPGAPYYDDCGCEF